MIYYTIENINNITDDFIEDIWHHEDILKLQSYYDELDFLWNKIIEYSYDSYFKSDKKIFIHFIEHLTDKDFDQIMYLIHSEEKNILKVFIENQINANNNSEKNNKTTIASFDKLFFQFLIKIKTYDLLSIKVQDYIIIGGNSRKKIRKQKKELLNSGKMYLMKTLYQRFKPIYIFHIIEK